MSKEVYIGVKGKVVAYDKYTGEELWRTHLRGSNFVSICVDDDIIIAHSEGHLFGLNKSNGEKKWENKMQGLGYGLASISTMGPGGLEETVQKIMRKKAAAGGAGSVAGGAT
jgi:outer membrane protein assembly factor BamB